MFYTGEGCKAEEGVEDGDERLDCSKKATTAEDFAPLAMQQDTYTNFFLGLEADFVSYRDWIDFPDVDFIPIDTIDDCEVEGDEVFSVFARQQELIDSSSPKVIPEASKGVEIVIVDNDGN